MRLTILIISILFGKLVWKDEFGNKYYKLLNKRWVLYKGIIEPSKISNAGKMWLAKQIDDIKEAEGNPFNWEKPSIPNLTGTNNCYIPKHSKKGYNSYEKWSQITSSEKNEKV